MTFAQNAFLEKSDVIFDLKLKFSKVSKDQMASFRTLFRFFLRLWVEMAQRLLKPTAPYLSSSAMDG